MEGLFFNGENFGKKRMNFFFRVVISWVRLRWLQRQEWEAPAKVMAVLEVWFRTVVLGEEGLLGQYQNWNFDGAGTGGRIMVLATVQVWGFLVGVVVGFWRFPL